MCGSEKLSVIVRLMAVPMDSNIYFTSSSLPGRSVFSNVLAKQEPLFKPTEDENLISNQSIHLRRCPVESLYVFQVKGSQHILTPPCSPQPAALQRSLGRGCLLIEPYPRRRRGAHSAGSGSGEKRGSHSLEQPVLLLTSHPGLIQRKKNCFSHYWLWFKMFCKDDILKLRYQYT